jgi:hypothetical protein
VISDRHGATDGATVFVVVVGVPPSPPPDPEVCGDGIDDNGDGQIDEGCAPPVPLPPPPGEVCGDGIDNNGDGQIDEGCAPPPPPPGEVCGDGIDNNGDGQIDEGCTPPPPPGEVCGDGIDNNGDGQIDEGCAPSPPPPPGEVCGDGIDNNSDGQVDEGCEPPPPPSEVCGDGIDNNADGQIDEGCAPPPPPPPPGEVCGDAIDNNGDGQIDEGCAPPPPPPPPPGEVCGDAIDNNGDGQIDEGCAPPPPPGEFCGDGIDNNSDGVVDGGCSPPVPPGVAIVATKGYANEEGSDPGLFEVFVHNLSTGQLGAPSNLVVHYTVGGSASFSDYAALSSDGDASLAGSLTIPSGAPSGSIQIVPVDDADFEMDETVTITLSGSSDYVILDASATVTIFDNECVAPAPSSRNADFQTTLEQPAGVADEYIAVDALSGNVHFDFPTWAGYGRTVDGTALLPEWRSNDSARPIITANLALPDPKPELIQAQITLGPIAESAVYFNTAGLAPFDQVRIAVQANATTLPTGHYDYTLTLTSQFTDGSTSVETITGGTEVVNLAASTFGDGWWLEGLDR